jgi:hypothetical protein
MITPPSNRFSSSRPKALSTEGSKRYEGFSVYENPDDTYHILVVAGGGGYIFADRFNSRVDAEWCAWILNLAIAKPGGEA